ncbi:MAG: hypothetical protein ACLVG5_05565 [Clostridium sp.]
MQEHEYKARDKTVQKMSRDGLREKNLRSKKEKRITGREADEENSRTREQELTFERSETSYCRRNSWGAKKENRPQSRHAFLEQEEIASGRNETQKW